MAELGALKPEDLRGVLEQIGHVEEPAVEDWPDAANLSQTDKVLLELRLTTTAQNSVPENALEEIETRIRARSESSSST